MVGAQRDDKIKLKEKNLWRSQQMKIQIKFNKNDLNVAESPC